jgi:hypothetical protein
MTTITSETVVCHSDAFVTATVDDALVMMSLEKGAYYGLDEIGSQIWTQLAEPTRVAALCETLAARYEAPRAQIEADVTAFLQELLDEGMIQIVPAGKAADAG